jgi:hypothetical protein
MSRGERAAVRALLVIIVLAEMYAVWRVILALGAAA